MPKGLVYFPAITSNLATGTSERAKASHLHHGAGKVCRESFRVSAGLVVSSGERLPSPPVLGQLDFSDVANDESMLVSL
ncbi:hypothetical protein F0562_001168 [Nyssa sinensis]|uniref:Uncharacterized protein n=1 Tax=Nyssa sinensis TaxID=561372 RepID=A0A5J5C3V2_9ASTE|nr:hypothetical protein F0562_001168 [Nyssa sinensis]